MSIEHNEQQTAAAQEPIGYRWRHSASEAWQYSNFPCGWEHQPLYAAPVTAALGIDLAALRARVVSAIERITSGTGQMRVPADLTDPDLVLADVLTLLDALDPHCTDSPKGGSEARDAVLTELVEAISAFKSKRGAFMALGAQDERTVRLWSALARVQASDAEVRP